MDRLITVPAFSFARSVIEHAVHREIHELLGVQPRVKIMSIMLERRDFIRISAAPALLRAAGRPSGVASATVAATAELVKAASPTVQSSLDSSLSAGIQIPRRMNCMENRSLGRRGELWPRSRLNQRAYAVRPVRILVSRSSVPP